MIKIHRNKYGEVEGHEHMEIDMIRAASEIPDPDTKVVVTKEVTHLVGNSPNEVDLLEVKLNLAYPG